MLNLAIGLPLRNQSELNELLKEIYDPKSPNYHHYLTPEQFAEKFGPTEKDYDKLIAFANANGFHVTATHPNRMLIDVSGSVANVQRALHITMHTYRHPTESRNFFAPDTEPSLDLDIPVLHISGLNNFSLPRPRYIINPKNKINATANDGTGPDGGFMGNDFRAAYVPGTALTGAGQTVALLQFDGYDSNDIAYYESQAGLPAVSLTNILIDGFDGNPAGQEVEVCLDIEMAISMAPGLSRVILYEAPNPSPFEDILNRMVTDDSAQQISCSWYKPNAISNAVTDQIFQQMAAQGQSFFNASGDSDAYTNLIAFPGDSPYITQVGGTSLTTDGTGAWSSESVWNWGAGHGSGGGISTQYPIPSWQTNISMASNQGSTTMRNTPDVALTADNIYVRADGLDYNVGGTSAAAPLWAGFAALVNQRAAQTGVTPIGFINPALDVIASGSRYSSAFNDITNGNNTSGTSPTKFYAVSGYDLCTGWGTPKLNLITLLANPEPLVITPSNGFASSGGFGGPFTITSQNFSLTNFGTSSLNWSLSNTSAWLNVSVASGTLNPGDPATTLTVSLNSAASNLNVGNYSATILFTNLNDNVVQARQFTLSVAAPPVITVQPVDLTLPEGATANFAVTATGTSPLSYQWQFKGTNLSNGGNFSETTSTNLTIVGISSSNVGPYTVLVTNIASSVISSNAFLSITTSPPIIVIQPSNQTVIVGQTATFSAMAIGSTPLTYQWTKNGTNLDGETGTNLIILDTQTNDTGVYSIIVTNDYGITPGSNALLTVQALPDCYPAPSGLVAWWKAEANENDSAGTNNGIGSIAYTNGVVGQAFHCTASTITIADSSAFQLTNALTIEGWLRPNSSGSYTVFWRGDNRAGLDPYVLSMQGNNNITFAISDASNNTATVGNGVNIPYNQWTYIAVTFNSTNGLLQMYTNSVLADQVTTAIRPFGALDPNQNPAVCIGSINNGGFQYHGDIDELSLYSRALSANEIAAIYQAGSYGKCPPPPTIVTQPASQTVVVSNTATFSVTATGTQPLFYQWNFNGTNIPGATNISLILTNVQFSQAGNYMVQVANTGGSVNSSNAVLTVIPQPPCYGPPPGLVAWWPAEGNARDSAGTNNGILQNGVAFASGEVGQAFLFNTTNATIKVAASPTLNVGVSSGFTIESWINLSNIVPGQSDPIVEWNTGTGTYGVHLHVNVSFLGNLYANIVDTSGSQHLIYTTTATIKTNVFQHVALTYDKASGVARLYCDGGLILQQTIGSFTPQTTYDLYLGQGRRPQIYEFPGKIDEASIYNRALSSNEITSIYLAGVSGKCPQPPTIFIQPTNRSVALSGTTTFTVTASGTPPLFYQWYFDNTNIIGATNASLTLNNAQFLQAGIYMVQVANTGGSVNSSNAILTVISPPIITAQPSPTNLTVLRGSNVTFSASAIGSLPLSYQWRFDGTDIPNATNTYLSLPDVQLNQAGVYAVLVTNLYGSVLSSNAVLIVNPLFHFIWNHIPSPRFVGTPFTVVIQAQNPTNGSATNFTDTVFLLSTNGVPVSPSVSGNFVQGVWTGAVTVSQTLTNLVLEAKDSFNETGFANLISIINLPTMGATTSDGTLYIYWPSDSSGFILETTPTLSPANWMQVPVSPILIGNQYLAPIPMTDSNAFYRLKFSGQ